MGRNSVLRWLLSGSWEHLRQAPPTGAPKAFVVLEDYQGDYMGAPMGLFHYLTASVICSKVVDAALAA